MNFKLVFLLFVGHGYIRNGVECSDDGSCVCEDGYNADGHTCRKCEYLVGFECLRPRPHLRFLNRPLSAKSLLTVAN